MAWWDGIKDIAMACPQRMHKFRTREGRQLKGNQLSQVYLENGQVNQV